MDDFTNDTAHWLETAIGAAAAVECEIGSLIAAATAWTEDEGELDDLVGGLLESGRVALSIG